MANLSVDLEKWARYKAVLEQVVSEGFAPPGHYNAKGAAVAEAQRRLRKEFGLPDSALRLGKWLKWQQLRKDIGGEHYLPDWSLYPATQALKGKNGFNPVLPGFEIASTSTTTRNGQITAQSIKQRPERGAPFKLPKGHEVKGVSALIGPDGRKIQEWIKTSNQPKGLTIDEIKAAFDEYKGKAELVKPPEQTYDDLTTTYVIGDHHLGLYCWEEETGYDYDLSIGESLLHDTMGELVAYSPAASTAIVLSLGDFFHTDSSNNTTARSNNALDVDTRRSKVVKIGVKLMISVIEMALQKHKRVMVRCLPGNHDNETTPTLAIALWAFFHNEPRVEVDISASRFFYHQFGKTLICATHGDMAKLSDMPGITAARHPEMWGETRFRYALGGHVHHKSKICQEYNGMICETFQVLPPADAWHTSMGYGAGRSMTSITYSLDRGEVSRNTVSVPPLR